MSKYDIMYGYHGTSEAVVDELISGNIDRSLGGGELGQGFYASNWPWVASAWAWQKHDQGKVLTLEIRETDFWALTPLALSYPQAVQFRYNIKRRRETRTFMFNANIVWAAIVGRQLNADQYKFESEESEDFINGTDVTRSIL